MIRRVQAEPLVETVRPVLVCAVHRAEQPRPDGPVGLELGVQLHQAVRGDLGVAPPAGAVRRRAEVRDVPAGLDPVDQRVAADAAVERTRDRVVGLGDHLVGTPSGRAVHPSLHQDAGRDHHLDHRFACEGAGVRACAVQLSGPGVEHRDADPVALVASEVRGGRDDALTGAGRRRGRVREDGAGDEGAQRDRGDAHRRDETPGGRRGPVVARVARGGTSQHGGFLTRTWTRRRTPAKTSEYGQMPLLDTCHLALRQGWPDQFAVRGGSAFDAV